MPRKDSVVLSPPTGERKCCFCGLKDDNEFEYGKFYEHDGIVTHYYCLLFSSNMQQRGLDDEGILGFLPEDINKELRRGRRLTCCYCKKLGATLGCCNTKCKKIFHFPCGLKAGSLHQYFGEFRSYCIHHRLKQNIDARILKEISQCEAKICYICYDEVEPRDNLRTIWAPCCKKNAWFHRTCVQQLAMSAGYFFKCPLCNNKLEFQRAMLDHGIFIPSQDASWELVPNAFQELLYRHNRCDAETCHCPKGREYTSTNAKWELTLCRTCGSQGIHMSCGNLKWGESMWECGECISILNKSELSDVSQVSRLSDKGRVLTNDRATLIDDDTSNDSEISVGTDASAMPMEATVSSSLISQSSADILQKPTNVGAQSAEISLMTKLDDKGHIISSKALDNGFGQHQEARKIPENNDELSPLTKKPKISDSSLDPSEETVNDDSDDDIIVVSGPSRNETFRSVDIPWAFTNSSNKQGTNENQHRLECQNVAPEDSSGAQIGSRSSIDPSTTTRATLTSNNATSTIENRVPIEIDLSDSECASTTSVSSTVPSIPTVIPEIPELNIQITNVTSLAPEAFESAPECFDRTIEASINNARNYTTCPVVGNQVSDSQRIYERMEIVRLEHTPDTYIPSNSFLYGLTIPGTCNTVPLIISAPDFPPPTLTAPSQGDRNDNEPQFARSNDNSSFALTTNDLASTQSPNSRVEETARTILPKTKTLTNCNNEKSNAPKNRNDEKSMGVKSKLTYSVPLEAVVNDQILQSRSADKGSRRTSVIEPSTKTDEKPVKSVIMRAPRDKSVKTKSTNSSSGTALVPPNDVPLSEVVSFSVSQTQGTGQPGGPPESQTAWNIPNGLTITRVIDDLELPAGQASSHVQNGYSSPLATNMNAGWSTNDMPRIFDPDLDITPADRSSTNMQDENTPRIEIENGRDIRSGEKLLQVSSDNCDGDAGSGSAVQSASVEATSFRITTTSDSQLVAETNSRDSRSGDRKIEEKNDVQNPTRYVAEKSDSLKRSITGDWNNSSDRTGLMEKIINLRDIKFTVSDLNIVKMTLYETYFVNINVESGKKRRKSSLETSNISRKKGLDFLTNSTKNSLVCKNETGNIAGNDFEDLPSFFTKYSTSGPPVANDSELSNESSNNTRNNVASTESETRINELSRTGVDSRGQDELKENLNPVPSPTNVANDITSALERKSKTRLRSHGVNKHTMQMLNERESPEKKSDDNNSNSHKIINNDQSFVKIPPINPDNSWKDNAYSVARRFTTSTDDDTNSSRNSYDPRNENYARKSRTRASCTDDNSEISSHVEPAAKRLKFISNGNLSESQDREKLVANNSKNDHFMAMSRLVSNVERTRSLKKSPRINVHKNGKFNVNNMIKDRGRTRETGEFNGKTLPCCKVSIDLARIRSILAGDLDPPNEKKDSKLYEDESELDNENRRKNIFRTKSFHCDVPKRSRSLVNLAITETSGCNLSIVKTRRWKSAENLDSLSRRSRRDDTVNSFRNVSLTENTRRGCKRKTRSFEKHDCVR